MNKIIVGMSALMLMFCLNVAQAQYPGGGLPVDGGIPEGYYGQQQGGVAPFSTNLRTALPGRVWFQTTLADNGLGYSGAYATLGAKTRIFQDYFDGRWLVEGQANVALEDGGFFGNIGLSRVVSIDSAGADIALGLWFDRDSSGPSDFNHTMDAVGISGSIKTQNFDLIGNGYLPIGTSDFSLGDPTGVDCFLNHSIVLQAGIDSALQGFDATLRLRPYYLSMFNGTFDIGGYSYGSDLVPDFNGVRVRLGGQPFGNGIVGLEVNHDDRFNTTAALSLGWQFGGRGNSFESSRIGRDLEKTQRNDHVARFNQELILARHPDTNDPYLVYHVDNNQLATGDGTFDSPFLTLKEAEAAASENSIIFVNFGDGTDTGMDEGIILQDGQQLLANGTAHTINVQNGGTFQLCNDLNGLAPTISNDLGAVVTLADGNTVRGFNIDASGATFGIFSNGTSRDSVNTIENNTIDGALIHGISVNFGRGAWNFANNTITGSATDGIHIENSSHPSGTFAFDDNTITGNGRDGIHMLDFDGRVFRFRNNVVNNNGRDGIHLENFINTRGIGTTADFLFLNPTIQGNARDGIHLNTLDGLVQIFNPLITGNSENGINMFNVTTTDAGEVVEINTLDLDTNLGPIAGTSVISGNGVGGGAGILNQIEFGRQRFRVRNSTLNGNGNGIIAGASGFGTLMDSQVVDNLSISNNNIDGVRFFARSGATHTALLENTAGGGLAMNGNGANFGNGVSLVVSGGGNITQMVATLRNLNILNSGNEGIFGTVSGNGNLDTIIEDSTISDSVANGITMTYNSNNTEINSLTVANNTITVNHANGGNATDGIQVRARDTAHVDAFIDLNDFTVLNDNPNDGIVDVAGDAIDFVMTDDSRTRARVTQNTVVGLVATGLDDVDTTEAGFEFIARDTAQLVAAIEANDLSLLTEEGISLISIGDGLGGVGTGSRISARVSNNLIQGAGGTDYNFRAGTNGRVDALVSGNAGADLLGSIDGVSEMFLAFTGNGISGGMDVANPAAVAPNFVVEVDNLSNSPAFPNFQPDVLAFTRPPFGTVVEPAIEAQEAAFSLIGFP